MSSRGARRFLPIILIAGFLLVSGCGDDDDGGTAPDTTPPAPITSVTVTIGDGSATLRWHNPPEDFAKAQIRRSDTGPVTSTTGVVVYEGGDTNTYLDEGLTNGTTYFYGIIALDGAGNLSPITHAIAALPAPEVVTFDDANLEAAIRIALGLAPGDIMTTDLLPLAVLEARNAGIADLTGLEHCLNLQTLKLAGNDLENADLDVLLLLHNLLELDVSGNNLTAIPNLTTLDQLWNLSVAGNGAITSLGTVGAVPRLQTLDITSTGITSLAPLTGASLLASLSFHDTAISNLTPLAGLSTLRYLYLNGAAVADLQPISGLTDLVTLAAADNLIVDVTPIAGLMELASLNLGANGIHDLQALQDNTGLGMGDILYIQNNPLLHAAVATQIPTLMGRGVEVMNSEGLPTEAVGVWAIGSVTINGEAADPADFFEWDEATVTSRLWTYYNNTYLAQELDADDDVVYYDSGDAIIDGQDLTIQMTNENGTASPPEVSFQGSWAVNSGDLVLTQTDGGDTFVLIWTPVP